MAVSQKLDRNQSQNLVLANETLIFDCFNYLIVLTVHHMMNLCTHSINHR